MWRWLLLLVVSVPAWAAPDEWPLKQVFGQRNVGMVQTGSTASVELCVKEECRRFALAGADRLAILHDFAFLYLALVENYDIEQAKAANGQRHFAQVLQRQKGKCAGPDETAVARCALAGMAARYPVTGSLEHMVDGWNRRDPWDIKAELRRAKIIP